MTKRNTLFLLVAGCLASAPAVAQQGFNDVRLFQSFYEDARISSSHYVGGKATWADFDNFDVLAFHGLGGFVLTPEFEIEGNIGYARFSNGGSESGLLDPFVNARYLFRNDLFDFALGGFLTIPVGDEDIGQDTFDVGAFGAVRFPLDDRLMLSGHLSVSSLEFQTPSGTDRETSVGVGVGLIAALTRQTHLIGELAVESETDYVALSGGVDHLLPNGARLRGALIVGLDDGAPDIGLTAEFLFSL